MMPLKVEVRFNIISNFSIFEPRNVVKVSLYVYVFCLFQAVFFVSLGWFSFFNVQKTKYLQLITTASRWIGE